MLSRFILLFTLGISLLVIGCNDVTNFDSPETTDRNSVELRANPNSGSTILDIAASNENFSILAQAVLFAGLDEALDGRRQLTVFAPTDDAFIALLRELGLTPEQFFVEENKGLIRDVLLYHVAPGKRNAKSVIDTERIRMLLGKFTEIESEDGNVFIGNEENGFATIVQTNIFASNGVIHVIDSVLLPPTSVNDDDDYETEENDDDDDDDNDQDDE